MLLKILCYEASYALKFNLMMNESSFLIHELYTDRVYNIELVSYIIRSSYIIAWLPKWLKYLRLNYVTIYSLYVVMMMVQL